MKQPVTSSKVAEISAFLQKYMQANEIVELTADQCAEILDKNGVLSKVGHPKPGFNFRQVLRDGRDNLIPMVTGASQNPKSKRWKIERV